MSSLAITRIGLEARDEGWLVSKSLLLYKFKLPKFLEMFISFRLEGKQTESKKLFPSIRASQILNFTNTIRGMAIVCAADDLELSYNGDNGQIEIFDNFVPANAPQSYHDQMQYGGIKASLNTAPFPSFDKSFSPDLGSSYHSSHFGIEEYSPMSLSSGHSQTLRFPFDQFNLNRPPHSKPIQHNNEPVPDFGMGFMGSHQSHFDIMSSGVQLETQFTDFKSGTYNNGMGYGSSIESFDSPLDEMFITRSAAFSNESIETSAARKRKSHFNGILEFAPTDSSKIESGAYEGQKRVKREFVGQIDQLRPASQEDRGMGLERPYNSQEMGISEIPRNNTLKERVKVEDEEVEKGRYACGECDAVFKVKSYLTRHTRKHNNAKAFVCPFYREQDSEYCGTSKAGTKCHPTGGFSRKDTYKTHLKALHFIYPPRTKSSERGTQGGRCAGCFQYFESNADWFKFHIEDGSCRGFVSNSRVEVKQETRD
ncbi:hypothetical protein OY671_001275 [Metschnikowia pulcherrima]|nr:hypothetical protein OY671_001275 [Metschnikowia pulcherrima]